MKILFVGGGTGGHIFPIIAITREIRKLYPEKKIEFFFLGPKDSLGEIFLSQDKIKVKNVLAGKNRRYFTLGSILANLVDILFKIPIGILQAFFHIFFLSPDLIFSKGGFGSVPGVVAGWLLRVPIFLHESDSVAGMTNQFLAKFAREIFISFPKTLHLPKTKTILVGNPIRKELLNVSKDEAENFFKLTGEKPVILVLGGSQGAQRINDKILEILPEILENFELIHQCGEKNFKEVKAEAEIIIPYELRKYYHLFPFLNEFELRMAYGAADLVVSRAGAGSIFEIAALGKPSILIPLPESAQNHQLKNAYSYAESGAAKVLEEMNFSPRFFLAILKQLFANPEELEKMRMAALKFAKPEAAKIIAGYIVSFLTQ